MGFDISLLDDKIGQLNTGLNSLEQRIAGNTVSTNNTLSAMQGL